MLSSELSAFCQHPPDQPICCALEVVCLDALLNYSAVSYVWGPKSHIKVISVNGHDFSVRVDLWNFLLQMRINSHQDPLRIDAICINQNGLAERSARVSAIGHIYKIASRVFEWLGGGSVTVSQLARDVIEHDWPTYAEVEIETEKFTQSFPVLHRI